MSTLINVPGTLPSGAVDRSINNLGTSSIQILAPSTGRKYVQIHNPSTTINAGISLSGTPAAIGSGGTITLLPGGTYTCEDSKILSNGFNGISASGINNGLTIWEIAS